MCNCFELYFVLQSYKLSVGDILAQFSTSLASSDFAPEFDQWLVILLTRHFVQTFKSFTSKAQRSLYDSDFLFVIPSHNAPILFIICS
jgi:hypothetical protein